LPLLGSVLTDFFGDDSLSKLKNSLFLMMILSALVTVSVRGQDEKSQDEKDKSSETKDDLKTLKDIQDAMSKEQSKAIQGLRGSKPGTAEYNKALANYYGITDKYADRIFALVKENPADRFGSRMLSNIARTTRNAKIRGQAMATMLEIAKADPKSQNSFQMLMMLVTGPTSPMMKDEATNLLMQNFGDSEKMGDLAMSLTRSRPTPQNLQLLKNLLEKSSHDSVKGPATYALAKLLSGDEKTREEGMELLKSIPEKYPDVKVYNGRMKLADMVAGEIFELENLQIGMDVPDIEGEDVDGVQFKLSDYKGKVVVIDFWGDW